MQSPHINEYGNLCIKTKTFSSCNLYFFKKLVMMELKQSNIKGFFTYGFSSLFFLRAEEKVVLTVCTAEI